MKSLRTMGNRGKHGPGAIPPLGTLIYTVFLLTFLPYSAFAQEPVFPDSILTFELEEVVITATRGGGDPLQLPMAIATINAQDFASSRNVSLHDALATVPGVLVQSHAGGSDVRLTIRGFGARGNGDRSNAATIRGIKVLIDGIPETEPDGRTSLDLVDLASIRRVEIIRTNASTLFGNASGGVIHIETFPSGLPLIATRNTFGSYGLRKNNLNVETGIGVGRLSVSFTNSAMDGWRMNSNARSTQAQAGLITELDSTAKLKVMISGTVNDFSIPGPLTFPEFQADPRQANPVYESRRERRSNSLARLAAEFSKTFSPSSRLGVLFYATPKHLVRSERGTFRQFYRLHTGFGAVYSWIPEYSIIRRITAGLDGAYQDGAILFYNLVNGEQGSTLRTNKKEGAATLGAFAQIDIPVVSSVVLTAGGRFDRQIYLSQGFASSFGAGTVAERIALNHFTPRLSLLYRLHERHSVYATFSGGIEAPAFNEVDPPPSLPNVSLNPLLKPMTSTTFEAGAKGFFFPRNLPLIALSYSVALYRIAIHDEIVPYDGGSWFFSVGTSRRDGFEVGGQMEFQGGISLSGSLTYLNALYQNYSNETGNFGGNNVPGIAPLVWNARLKYVSPFGPIMEVGFDHIGRYAVNDMNTVHVPASTIWNAAIATTHSIGRVQLSGSLGVNNLANLTYVGSAYINPSGGGNPSYIEAGLPRNIFVNAGARILY